MFGAGRCRAAEIVRVHLCLLHVVSSGETSTLPTPRPALGRSTPPQALLKIAEFFLRLPLSPSLKHSGKHTQNENSGEDAHMKVNETVSGTAAPHEASGDSREPTTMFGVSGQWMTALTLN